MTTETHDSIYIAAVKILSGLAPLESHGDHKEIVIYGTGNDLESIVLVNFILALEEELNLNYQLELDLVELLPQLGDPVTLGMLTRQIRDRIQAS